MLAAMYVELKLKVSGHLEHHLMRLRVPDLRCFLYLFTKLEYVHIIQVAISCLNSVRLFDELRLHEISADT